MTTTHILVPNPMGSYHFQYALLSDIKFRWNQSDVKFIKMQMKAKTISKYILCWSPLLRGTPVLLNFKALLIVFLWIINGRVIVLTCNVMVLMFVSHLFKNKIFKYSPRGWRRSTDRIIINDLLVRFRTTNGSNRNKLDTVKEDIR